MIRPGIALRRAAIAATALLGLWCAGASAQPAVSYTTDNPGVLVPLGNPQLAVRATPERVLYRVGAEPRIEIRAEPRRPATLDYRVLDGFGKTLLSQSAPAAGSSRIAVELPAGHGYYEVVATLRDGRTVLAEARRSIGVLRPPPKPVGDEPFGLWIQGESYYPELGVRWIRDGIHWDSWRAYGDRYLAEKVRRYRRYHDQGIRVIAYPKGHPRPHQTSREVIADTPDAWRAEEEWWTRIVRSLAGHVDAWAVVNEPMRGHWKGSDELIVRYWQLMRRILQRHDPRTPLLGPSLAPNSRAFLDQYRDLLALGFGKYIDAVELHTYVTQPEDGKWRTATRRVQELTREATGRDLAVWSTEHGSSATYAKELEQAQHLMRSWLEAKRIGYPVMIWHMFSHPQSPDMREMLYGIFRNVAKKIDAPPQPRPAGVAYGVMTRQLAGASYRTRLEHLGPFVHGYVFERAGQAVLALWSTAPRASEVTLPVGEAEPTVTGLFGRTETPQMRDGQITLTADRSPKFIAPLPDFYLKGDGIGRVTKPVELLPGRSVRTALKLANPAAQPAKLSVEWAARSGWTFSLPRKELSLGRGQEGELPVTITAAQQLAPGAYQLYAKVLLDGHHVTTLPVAATVLTKATLADARPALVNGRPHVVGTLRRLDRSLRGVAVQLDRGRSKPQRIVFDRDEASFALAVEKPASDRLDGLLLAAYGPQGEVQFREHLRLSFVPVRRLTRPVRIDGALDDWADLPAQGALNVRWAWDNGHVYLAARVRDERLVQSQAVTEMWKQDSLQIGIAPGEEGQFVREPRPGMQEAEMVELDLGLRPAGAALYRDRTVNTQLAPAGEIAQGDIAYAVRHRDGFTSYELRIPVAQLGLKPLRAGAVLRAALLVNASDGGPRRTTEWFGGIKEAKDPALFGHLILEDGPAGQGRAAAQ